MAFDPRSILSTDHKTGSKDAPVSLIEYGDYQCPACQAAYPVVESIRKRFKHDIQFAYRHFPLIDIHPRAMAAALAAEAANRQGRFWEMHRLLYTHEGDLSEDDLVNCAKAAGLELQRFARDFADPAITEKVRRDMSSGMRVGVSATPGFIVDGELFRGNWRAGDLDFAIGSRLGRGAALS